MYIGSTDKDTTTAWLMDDKDPQKLALEEVEYVPGLVKLFDEILVNALDNKARDKSMDMIKVDIKKSPEDPNVPEISVWNNGKGIPVRKHKQENIYIPELVLGNLLTGSNFDDSTESVSGGRYGYGAKLTNIFSKKFTVITADKKSGKTFEMVRAWLTWLQSLLISLTLQPKRFAMQTWKNNMQDKDEPKITQMNPGEHDYTCIQFQPDLESKKPYAVVLHHWCTCMFSPCISCQDSDCGNWTRDRSG